MGVLSDPGEWIVLAMVVVVHATVLLVRRFGGPFQWQALGVGLLPLGCCAAPLFAPYVTSSDSSAWPFLVPIVCGVYLGSRLSNRGLTILAVVVGTFYGGWLTGKSSEIVTVDGGYMNGNSRWITETPDDVLTDLEKIDDGGATGRIVKMPAGYVYNWPKRGSGKPWSIHDPIERYVARPLWHTWLTGISGRERHRYRLWTPGGSPREMSATARLVDVSPGSRDKSSNPPGRAIAELPRDEPQPFEWN